MYKLYYSPSACSLAIHALLNTLDQQVEAIDRNKAPEEFAKLESHNMVPVLVDDGHIIREGAAIVLYLLEKHKSPTLPAAGPARAHFLEWLMFANATLHPAYGRMFFISRVLGDGPAREQALKAGAASITGLWAVVEKQLQNGAFVCGEKMTAVDLLLAVYSGWNKYFPVPVTLGEKTQKMIAAVNASPAMMKAVEDEKRASA